MSFRIDPAAPVPDELRRTVLAQVDRTIGALEAAREDHANGLHQARKSIKKLRALLRLSRAADPDFARLQNRCVRAVARAIAGPREASAMVETLDRFIADCPGHVARASLDLIRRRLAARRDRVAGDVAALEPAVAAALVEMRTVRAAICAHDFSAADRQTLAGGAAGTMSRWKKALKRARRRGREEDFHDLRKALKAHEAHLGLLAGFGIAGSRTYHARIDALGERLGEFNDITVLRDALARGTVDLGADIELGPFRKLMRRKARLLQKQALKEGRRLLGRRPRRLRRALARAGPPEPAVGETRREAAE